MRKEVVVPARLSTRVFGSLQKSNVTNQRFGDLKTFLRPAIKCGILDQLFKLLSLEGIYGM